MDLLRCSVAFDGDVIYPLTRVQRLQYVAFPFHPIEAVSKSYCLNPTVYPQLQGNIGKSIISRTPKGLNEIAEYTLVYELTLPLPPPPSPPPTTSLPFRQWSWRHYLVKRTTKSRPRITRFESALYDIIEIWSLV